MHYIVAREEPLTISTANFRYEHNERKNNTYLNPDIDLSKQNYHYKKPTKSYIATFHDMVDEGLFSTRKVSMKNKDTALGSEIICAVSGDYFSSKEEAIEFYKIANNALNEFFTVVLPDGQVIKGEDLCISSVVHLDEGSPGLHYTTVTCVPREMKRRRTKKEMAEGSAPKSDGWYCQLSHAGFWMSEKDEKGKLYYSYSKLNDVIAKAYADAGYDDIQRGQKGSTQKHLHPNEYKAMMNQVRQEAKDAMEKLEIKKIAGKYVMDEKTYERLNTVQKKIAIQQVAIDKAQIIIDAQQKALKEEQIRIKKKEIEAEKIIKDNSKLAEQYYSVSAELDEKSLLLEQKDAEIKSQMGLLGFWETFLEWIMESINKIIMWIDALLHGKLDEDEMLVLQSNINKTYEDILAGMKNCTNAKSTVIIE